MRPSLKFIFLSILGIGVLVGVFMFMWWMFQQNATQTLQMTPLRASDQTFGNPNAKVVLLEYSDFQCPVCKQYEPILEQAHREYASSTLFAYRYFPLSQHTYALLAARSAEAAGMQGKFWDMAHALFANQEIWSASADAKPFFNGYARDIGLNMQKFEQDVASAKVSDKVTLGLEAALHDGIPGTPTFFLNGSQIQFQSYEELKKILDGALAR